MRWFSSDWHLSHRNVIEFCDRPFTDIDRMNQAILDTMNEMVGPDDTLWIIGDIAMGDINKSLWRLDSLVAGEVIIVAGNHDRCHPSMGKKHEDWIERYKAQCDRLILLDTNVTLGDGTRVSVSHFPRANTGDVRPGKTEFDKFADYRVEDKGQWHLCGHVHEKWRQQGRDINVGIDAWGGKPVAETELIELMSYDFNSMPAWRWV